MSRSYSPEDLSGARQQPLEDDVVRRSMSVSSDSREMGRSGGNEDQPRPENKVHTSVGDPRGLDPRKPYQHRGRTYLLRASEIGAMTDVGKFRAVGSKDLEEFVYAGDKHHLEADLINLRRQGLILEREVPHADTAPRRLMALTKEGHRLLVANRIVPKEQALYHGFTKPREVHHDADLYRLYQRGLEKIRRDGGTNPRVILDAELKKILYRDLARAKQPGGAEAAQSEIAERHGLRVVHGKIPVPDLRIEYQTPDQETADVDLELATEHYRFKNIAQKARAGFALYARPQDAANLRRVLEQREITAEILSL